MLHLIKIHLLLVHFEKDTYFLSKPKEVLKYYKHSKNTLTFFLLFFFSHIQYPTSNRKSTFLE
jgi:hypothetical protein